MLELSPVEVRAMREIVVDGLFHFRLRILAFRKILDMNHQTHWIVPVVLLDPAHDEFLRIMVEIFFMEWRRIHRIEELLDGAQTNLDPMVRQVPFTAQRARTTA